MNGIGHAICQGLKVLHFQAQISIIKEAAVEGIALTTLEESLLPFFGKHERSKSGNISLWGI
jgi:hypothetical protein